jgi:ABC-type uncharacterized transport system ATPase component
VPFLVGGLVVSFIMASASTYLVGERLSLLNLPRIFVTVPPAFDYLWLPAVGTIVLGLVAAVRRAAGRGGTISTSSSGGRGELTRYAALALVLSALAVLGAARGGRVHTIHIALVIAVAIWIIATVFHNSDRGLAHRAIGVNSLFRLRTDWRIIRITTLLLTGSIAGLTGVVLTQYKAQAISGGYFNIVIGALASYVIFDRLAVFAQRRRDALRVSGNRSRWQIAPLHLLADTNPATRAFLGCMVFYIATQYVIALVRHPELPRLFIGGFLLLVLGEWGNLFDRLSDAVTKRSHVRPDESESPALEVKDLWKGYARGGSVLPVLTGADLVIKRSDKIVRIRGSNAAGKTTLFRILDGTLHPDRGRCIADGVDITSLPRSERPVYLITQNPFETVATDLSVGENLRLAMLRRYSLLTYGPRDEWQEQCASILRRYGLMEIITSGTVDGLKTLAGNLSGGQAQCLAFAMAATAGPKLILADEPTANLDPKSTEMVLRLIEAVSKEFFVLLISHDERVANVCDRTYLLTGGRLYDEGQQLASLKWLKEDTGEKIISAN